MNKSGIKSVVSIEFGISIKEAGRIVDVVFDVLADFFEKNKNFEIRKFGRIDVSTSKDNMGRKIQTLKFTPSKKLARRANHNFDNLEKVKMGLNERKEEIITEDKLDYQISEEFIRQLKENKEEVMEILLEETTETIRSSRTLIPDKAIELHKEITGEEKKITGKQISGDRSFRLPEKKT